MPVAPYLFFNGRCQEALDFYTQAAGAQVESVMTYAQSPELPQPGSLPAGWADKIMHASALIGGARVLLSDGNSSLKPEFRGFALTLSVPTTEEAAQRFKALSDGGAVLLPLTETFYSPSFGMLNDRFGVMWMIMTM
jgi:PhnB protein